MKENSENKMKLSIVVPVYNVETTIERAVQSLFENKYKNNMVKVYKSVVKKQKV